MTGNVLKYVLKMLVNLSLNVLKNEGSYIKKSVVGNKMAEISHIQTTKLDVHDGRSSFILRPFVSGFLAENYWSR